MKNYIIITLLIHSGFSCVAQNNSEPIKVQKHIPTYGKAIRYRFPTNVEKLIDSVVTVKNGRFFIRLNSWDGEHELFLVAIGAVPIDTSHEVEIMLASTNRFYESGKKKIPIVVGEDDSFSFWESIIFFKSELFIRFKARKWYDVATILKLERNIE